MLSNQKHNTLAKVDGSPDSFEEDCKKKKRQVISLEAKVQMQESLLLQERSSAYLGGDEDDDPMDGNSLALSSSARS